MLNFTRRTRRRHSWAWRIATAIALLAQCWVAAASLADSRGLGASAHIEADGTNKHFAHDEASCAACTLLALHAPALERPAQEIPRPTEHSSGVAALAVEIAAADRPSNLSRAPPSK